MTPAADLDTAQASPEAPSDFVFTGNAFEYMRLWYQGALLTIVTLGLYAPWAKTRNDSYLLSRTSVQGASFALDAAPKQALMLWASMAVLLGAFVVWTGALLGIGSPVPVYEDEELLSLATLVQLNICVYFIAFLLPAGLDRNRTFWFGRISWQDKRMQHAGSQYQLTILCFFALLILFLIHQLQSVITDDGTTGDFRLFFLYGVLIDFFVLAPIIYAVVLIAHKQALPRLVRLIPVAAKHKQETSDTLLALLVFAASVLAGIVHGLNVNPSAHVGIFVYLALGVSGLAVLLLWPLFTRWKHRMLAGNISIGNIRVHATAARWQYFCAQMLGLLGAAIALVAGLVILMPSNSSPEQRYVLIGALVAGYLLYRSTASGIFWSRLRLDGGWQFTSNPQAKTLAKVGLGNFLLLVCSLGLLMPLVRFRRWKAIVAGFSIAKSDSSSE